MHSNGCFSQLFFFVNFSFFSPLCCVFFVSLWKNSLQRNHVLMTLFICDRHICSIYFFREFSIRRPFCSDYVNQLVNRFHHIHFDFHICEPFFLLHLFHIIVCNSRHSIEMTKFFKVCVCVYIQTLVYIVVVVAVVVVRLFPI